MTRAVAPTGTLEAQAALLALEVAIRLALAAWPAAGQDGTGGYVLQLGRGGLAYWVAYRAPRGVFPTAAIRVAALTAYRAALLVAPGLRCVGGPPTTDTAYLLVCPPKEPT